MQLFLANFSSIPPKPRNSSLSGLVKKSSHRIKRSVFQIRKYRKTRVLSDQVGISLPAYSTHVLQQSKQTQTKAKSENVFVHSFIPSRIFQRRRSKIYFQPSQVKFQAPITFQKPQISIKAKGGGLLLQWYLEICMY